MSTTTGLTTVRGGGPRRSSQASNRTSSSRASSVIWAPCMPASARTPARRVTSCAPSCVPPGGTATCFATERMRPGNQLAGTRRTVQARRPAAKGRRASIDATQMSAMKAQGKGRFGNREGAAGFCIVRWSVPCFRIDDDSVTDPRTDRLERVHRSCRHCDYQVGRPRDDIEDSAWNKGSMFELVPSSSLRACPGLAQVPPSSRGRDHLHPAAVALELR
jgi:hypothetical protein